MAKIKKLVRAFSIASLIAVVQTPVYAVDSASIELGSGNKTRLTRFGAQWNWSRQWWQSNGSHVGGYWDLTLAQWRASRYKNFANKRSLAAIGLTPVFRLQADSGQGFYLEGGIGVYLLSDIYDNNGRHLSTRFQFGDQLGIGYVFSNTLDAGLKFQHFSNGGIKQPNSGVNYILARLSYRF